MLKSVVSKYFLARRPLNLRAPCPAQSGVACACVRFTHVLHINYVYFMYKFHMFYACSTHVLRLFYAQNKYELLTCFATRPLFYTASIPFKNTFIEGDIILNSLVPKSTTTLRRHNISTCLHEKSLATKYIANLVLIFAFRGIYFHGNRAGARREENPGLQVI
jgi:hypothetical protein